MKFFYIQWEPQNCGILLYTVGTTKPWNTFIYWEPQNRGILLYTVGTTKPWNSFFFFFIKICTDCIKARRCNTLKSIQS